MNIVEPIRDGEIIKDIENYLKKENERDYIMFILGIYTGLRISDILRLRVKDVRNKDTIVLRDKKTGKQRFIPINNRLKRELKYYCDGEDSDTYLVKSSHGYNKAIKRETAYRRLKVVGNIFDIDSFGCHSLRKTFGYFFYKNTGDIVSLQKFFAHASPNVTLNYIGLEQEKTNKVIKNLKYY